MGFSRGFKEDKDTNQEAKLLGAPFMTSNQNPVLLQHHQQQQQQQQQNHHHHHQMNDPNHNQNNHHHHHQFPYGMMQASSSSSINNFLSKEASAYDLGDLDQALFLYLDGQEPSNVQEQRQMNTSHGMRPPTLNIFPSQPMHVEPSSSKVSTGLVSPIPSGSKRPSDPSIELANTRNENASIPAPAPAPAPPSGSEPSKTIKREGNRKGPTSSSEQEGPKTPDPKTLRRLAQNREAARKSRLRKKAYVQQLESSRIKLTQLEQELQRARAQGMFFGGGGMIGDQQGINPIGINNLSPDAAVFDMEYSRWIEEHHRLMMELRAAVQEHLPDNELRIFVDNCLAHFDQVMHLKSMIAKSDVFHLVSGMWKSPAERCFMWMGGFRPSELIKVIPGHLEPLTEQQIMGICGLQQSTQEAEEALSQGLEALHNSLSETLTSDSLSSPPNMANYMGQMALAINKLSTLEGFVRQADNLRHQTLHRLHQILTTRQAARCLLAIAEYFHRLRALSSLWVARPRQE